VVFCGELLALDFVLARFLVVRRLGVKPTRSGSKKRIDLSWPFLAFRFGLAPRCEFALLRGEVRTGF